MTKEKQKIIKEFIEDYNTLLEELNEELEPLGISNKLITKLDQVEIENLNCDPDLWHMYHDIKS